MQGWFSILLMTALGAGFALVAVLLSNALGPRRPSPEKSAPYECGMPAVGDARERQSVKFYLTAMIFLLFDIEVAFLYPWAMALRGPARVVPVTVPACARTSTVRSVWLTWRASM